MRRRQVLATAATSLGASVALAGCLDVLGDGTSPERDITAATIDIDHDELTGTVTIESDFTSSSPGSLAVELTNHEVTRVLLFVGIPTPRIGMLEHADESAAIEPMYTDHDPDTQPATPEEPEDGCWVHVDSPARPDFAGHVELEPGETHVIDYVLAAPKPRDDEPVPDPCLPSGTYTATGEDEYRVETADSPDSFNTTLEVTIEDP